MGDFTTAGEVESVTAHEVINISDTKRYQMLGNSIAVPCVAYIMQGITDAVNQACEKGGKKL